MALMNMKEAIRDALRTELARDPSVLVFGEDVGKAGGVFRATDGLQAEFGDHRVFDTPLAESAIAGLAVGLGTQGFRPVAEIQFVGFIFEAADQMFVQAARMRYRSGGRYHAPIVFRTPFGGGVKAAELHTDSLEGLAMQTPGMKVVIPSNPRDAKGLLISAIRDNDPVFFMEHLNLYHAFREEVPEGEYTVPIGQASVVREGKDVTIVAYGLMVHTSLKAAEELAKEGVSAEVIDLRTLKPLDVTTLSRSFGRTRRLVCVEEGTGGVGAEVCSRLAETAGALGGRMVRVAAKDSPIPSAGPLEARVVPQLEDIIEGCLSSLEG